MKRYKLKKSVKKVLATIFIVVISAVVYANIGRVGELAQDSRFYEFLAIIGWAWLVFIQTALLAMIWAE